MVVLKMLTMEITNMKDINIDFEGLSLEEKCYYLNEKLNSIKPECFKGGKNKPSSLKPLGNFGLTLRMLRITLGIRTPMRTLLLGRGLLIPISSAEVFAPRIVVWGSLVGSTGVLRIVPTIGTLVMIVEKFLHGLLSLRLIRDTFGFNPSLCMGNTK